MGFCRSDVSGHYHCFYGCFIAPIHGVSDNPRGDEGANPTGGERRIEDNGPCGGRGGGEGFKLSVGQPDGVVGEALDGAV